MKSKIHPNKLQRAKPRQVFGKLTLIKRVRKPKGVYGNVWQVRCVCGKVEVIREQYLFRSRNPKTDCGCSRRTIITEHPREYSIWKLMNKRCYDASHVSFPYYGALGITVCDAWRDGGISVSLQQNVRAFGAFVKYMGVSPSPKHTLDRRNPFKGYEPGNVKWSTHDEQARNKRANWAAERKATTKPSTDTDQDA